MPANTVEIRREQADDGSAIREVNRRAFGQDLEGAIVDALRAHGAARLSLVATLGGHVVGHILYSSVHLGEIAGAAIGPMSVLPDFQRQGIGSGLVEAGNRQLQENGCPFIVVLGHPAFYPRFGFEPASRHGIACEWTVPDEVFMALILDAARMKGIGGVARYRPEFSAAS
jgi:putative acetyltransferase